MLKLRAVHLLAIALTLVVVLAAAQSSVDEQLKKIHKKLASNGSGLGLQITPPTLAVIGLQSAVRSSAGSHASLASLGWGCEVCPVTWTRH
jgi:hypothetical protein